MSVTDGGQKQLEPRYLSNDNEGNIFDLLTFDLDERTFDLDERTFDFDERTFDFAESTFDFSESTFDFAEHVHHQSITHGNRRRLLSRTLCLKRPLLSRTPQYTTSVVHNPSWRLEDGVPTRPRA